MDSFFSSLWPVATEIESGNKSATGTTLKMEVLKAATLQEAAVMTADIEPAEKTTVEKRTETVDIGGMKFDQTRDGMSLAGHVSRVKYYGFQICNAALYMHGGSSSVNPESVMDPGVSKELVIGFLRYVPGVAFAFQTRDLITKNGFLPPTPSDAAKKDNVDSQVETFNGFYKDVNANDVFSLKYDATAATSSLCLNGSILGSIQGKTFSRALFSVWFGQHPFLSTMKDELLKGV